MTIKKFLDDAAKRYYAGNPFLSDEEFDALAEQNKYIEVGAKPSTGIPHVFPMYSLQKVYEGEEPPFPKGFRSIKLDGAAISLTYINGKLITALTRGDGVRGQPVTENIMAMPDIPQRIRTYATIVQITGEIVAPATVKNARNYAAGALSLKSVKEFKTRNLSFIAYGIEPSLVYDYISDLYWLIEQGFTTVLDVAQDYYPTDGWVYRVVDTKEYEKMGFTSHHPRGAYALKKQKVGVVTRLNNVIWNVGRTGAISPVAVLDPVEIDGAIVSKATLHNMKYIEALGLEEGCNVRVIRSGDIIPRVVERVD